MNASNPTQQVPFDTTECKALDHNMFPAGNLRMLNLTSLVTAAESANPGTRGLLGPSCSGLGIAASAIKGTGRPTTRALGPRYGAMLPSARPVARMLNESLGGGLERSSAASTGIIRFPTCAPSNFVTDRPEPPHRPRKDLAIPSPRDWPVSHLTWRSASSF